MAQGRYEAYGADRRHGVNEFSTRSIAEKVIKPGDAVLDLGANTGFHTREFSKKVGPAGKVHAFEPNYSLWPMLLAIEHVRVWPVAVGDRISVENFFVPMEQNWNQVGSIVDPRDFLGPVDVRVLSVPQVTLDSLEELKSENITFAKIDIERREEQCFRGARDMFAKLRPVVVFENNTPETERILQSLGYRVVDLINKDLKISLANVLAVPEEKLAMIGEIVIQADELEAIFAEVETLMPA